MDHEHQNCLHCQINELITKYLQRHDVIDATEVMAKLAESMVDLILLSVPPEMHGKMLAHTLCQLGSMVLKKTPSTTEDRAH